MDYFYIDEAGLFESEYSDVICEAKKALDFAESDLNISGLSSLALKWFVPESSAKLFGICPRYGFRDIQDGRVLAITKADTIYVNAMQYSHTAAKSLLKLAYELKFSGCSTATVYSRWIGGEIAKAAEEYAKKAYERMNRKELR